MKLSVRRADSVKAYLVSKGIGTSRITPRARASASRSRSARATRDKELIACLEPNPRRDEAVGSATK